MIREGQERIPAGCAISGVVSHDGKPVSGGEMIRSIATMHDRSNGLGGGFAGYGIYPKHKDEYALHLIFDDEAARLRGEKFLLEHFEVQESGVIPTKKHKNITSEPLIWRYFAKPRPDKLRASQLDEKEFVVRATFAINGTIEGAYVFSSGKNMGVFKAVGYPEDVGEFYKLDEYEGFVWTAHGRYPTNTPGWWGGAHPFALLDSTIVHNGEISSYDANRRFIEMFGYACTLLTDTEVITYILDFLTRRQGLSLTEASKVIAAPFWEKIERMEKEEREELTYLRSMFPSLLITGPFSILYGFTGGLMALNDRLKLRSMVVGEGKTRTYISSEECAIRVLEEDVKIWSPVGGEPVIITTGQRGN
ncbi:MAG: glutamine amidotransferase family protein [Christensenellaceae bacterium]|jgi:glutamate synthase domain-containing protein 1|nr:glutamine amidotransferase family protein [Christensenellaceae bacterium]